MGGVVLGVERMVFWFLIADFAVLNSGVSNSV